jgi:hypothetical protein
MSFLQSYARTAAILIDKNNAGLLKHVLDGGAMIRGGYAAATFEVDDNIARRDGRRCHVCCSIPRSALAARHCAGVIGDSATANYRLLVF